MHRSPSFTRIHHIDLEKEMAADSGIKRTTLGLTRSSSSRFSQPNQAHLPSLKMLSERLGTASGSKSVPSALSEMSTNVPTEPVGRLKLPASAVARAHITPSGGKSESPLKVALTVDIENIQPSEHKAAQKVEQVEQSAEEGVKKPEVPVADTATPKAESHTVPAKAENIDTPTKVDATSTPASAVHKRVLQSRASLGVGYRPPTPETPQRTQTSSQGEATLPEIVVQSSTPGKVENGAAAEPITSQTADLLELPLAHSWTLFYDSRTYKADPADIDAKIQAKKMSIWEASLLIVGAFDTVQAFARLMNNIREPGRLNKGANYHLFKDGIRPSWEDPANTHGGKWVLFTKTNELTNACWSSLVMALVGEILDPENHVTGIVVSPRPRADRIQVWMRSKHDVHTVNAMGARIMDTICPEPRELDLMTLEFQSNKATESFPPNKFMRHPANGRSVSVASSPVGGPPLRRLPGSPVGPHSPLSPSSPRLGVRPIPMQRGNSGGNSPSNLSPHNPFTGPLGSARRLVSTPKDGGF